MEVESEKSGEKTKGQSVVAKWPVRGSEWSAISDRSRKTCIPRQITLGAGVDDGVLIDGQEVEISVVSSGHLFQPFVAFVLVDQLAHVLDDELVALDVLHAAQAPAGSRFELRDLRVFASLEPLILTELVVVAVGAVALVEQQPIYAVVAGARVLGLAFADLLAGFAVHVHIRLLAFTVWLINLRGSEVRD